MVPTLLKAGWLDTWEMVFSRFYAMTSFQLLHKAVYDMASLFAAVFLRRPLPRKDAEHVPVPAASTGGACVASCKPPIASLTNNCHAACQQKVRFEY